MLPQDSRLQDATLAIPYTRSLFFLHVLAVVTTLLTFLLLYSGGLVTSKGVGMSVPDWPTTYGYNMFLFPISRWVGGIFYEHSHRLLASGIGLLTVLLTVATFALEKRRLLRTLVVIALFAVMLQGLLGGLRVTLCQDQIGIFHGILSQSFFSLLLIFSVVTSRQFSEGCWFHDPLACSLRRPACVALVLVYFQLIIAATMRHSHLGLSIPDFPTAYGHLLPPFSEQALVLINKNRLFQGMMPTTIFQISLQMIHRTGALLLSGVLVLLIMRSYSNFPKKHWARRWSAAWGCMLLCQVMLGAWTIWSNKAADIATMHMALGALMLGAAYLFVFRIYSATSLLNDN